MNAAETLLTTSHVFVPGEEPAPVPYRSPSDRVARLVRTAIPWAGLLRARYRCSGMLFGLYTRYFRHGVGSQVVTLVRVAVSADQRRAVRELLARRRLLRGWAGNCRNAPSGARQPVV